MDDPEVIGCAFAARSRAGGSRTKAQPIQSGALEAVDRPRGQTQHRTLPRVRAVRGRLSQTGPPPTASSPRSPPRVTSSRPVATSRLEGGPRSTLWMGCDSGWAAPSPCSRLCGTDGGAGWGMEAGSRVNASPYQRARGDKVPHPTSRSIHVLEVATLDWPRLCPAPACAAKAQPMTAGGRLSPKNLPALPRESDRVCAIQGGRPGRPPPDTRPGGEVRSKGSTIRKTASELAQDLVCLAERHHTSLGAPRARAGSPRKDRSATRVSPAGA